MPTVTLIPGDLNWAAIDDVLAEHLVVSAPAVTIQNHYDGSLATQPVAYHTGDLLFPLAGSGKAPSLTWTFTVDCEPAVETSSPPVGADEIIDWGFEARLRVDPDADPGFWATVATLRYAHTGNYVPAEDGITYDKVDHWSWGGAFHGASFFANDAGAGVAPPQFVAGEPISGEVTWDEATEVATYTLTQGALVATITTTGTSFLPASDGRMFGTVTAHSGVDPEESSLAGTYTSFVVTWGEAPADPCGRRTDATWNPAGL